MAEDSTRQATLAETFAQPWDTPDDDMEYLYCYSGATRISLATIEHKLLMRAVPNNNPRYFSDHTFRRIAFV